MAGKSKAEREAWMREAEEARAELRAIFPPGSDVPMIVLDGHAYIFAVATRGAGDPQAGKPYIRNITFKVAKAVPGWKVSDKTGGINVRGAPTRYAFHVAYTLGHALYPEGYTVDRASGAIGRNGAADGTHDPDGGYALRANDL